MRDARMAGLHGSSDNLGLGMQSSGNTRGALPGGFQRKAPRARAANFERGCNHPLGEFSFFRARPAAARPVAWRYTNAAYQDEHE